MLINLREYHRPTDMDEALQLLRRAHPRTVVVAGGTSLVGSADDGVAAVVDLQDLGLSYIRHDAATGTLRIGATTTLADLSTSPLLREVSTDIIAEAAHRSTGSVLRQQATVGGAVAVAAPNDELVVALLAADAYVLLHSGRLMDIPLTDFLPRRHELLDGPGLISEIAIAPLPGMSAGASARVARTPADTPIVCAAAVLALEGDRCTMARLALGGVGPIPLRLPEIETALIGQTLAESLLERAVEPLPELIHPDGDFRGSAEYRQRMAQVIGRRALGQAVGRLIRTGA